MARVAPMVAGTMFAAAACGGGTPATRDDATGMPAVAAAPVPAAGAAERCPATGAWALCHVMKSLERSGLAPRLDSGTVDVPPLSIAGSHIHVGSAELTVFVYGTTADRERDERSLDRGKYIGAGQEPTMRNEPTLIHNANLLAMLESRNAHQRERVSDALTVGPPQPPAPAKPVTVKP